MQSLFNSAPAELVVVPLHGFRLLVEPEPRLRTFFSNLIDLLRPYSPPLLIGSQPGTYWPDALVHRPVAWVPMRQSFLVHLLAVVAVYAGSLWWLNQPRVLTDDPSRTTTILHYELSEYLPAVNPARVEAEVPVRSHAQTADPEYSPQKIISLNPDHNSTRQTIIQPDPTLIQRDVPLPNLMAWTPILGTAPMAARHAFPLPRMAAQVVAPPQEALSSRLVFPLPPQPEIVAPAARVANRPAIEIPASAGPMVVPPSQSAAIHDSSRLQIPAMAPPQVAAPASGIASAHTLPDVLPANQPAVVAPSQRAGQRDLRKLGMPEQSPAAVPPAQPITSGAGRAEAREMGRLLALNARPVAPTGPVNVPEGNRKGEFTAGPEGHVGASAAPETRRGDTAKTEAVAGRGNANATSPSSVYVAPPPGKIRGDGAASSPGASTNRAGESDLPAPERIENQVFGGRKRYTLRLNMPNLTSATGSWIIRFAELKAGDVSSQGEISSPEPVRKVDPLYPAALREDRVEGVVILHAIIRSDGSVGDVRVLEGFNDQLDSNARTALEQWRFRPGTRNGVPVDVEAVVRVPFRVPRLGY